MIWKEKRKAAERLVQAWDEELAAHVPDGMRRSFRKRIFLFDSVCDRGERLEQEKQIEEAKYAEGIAGELLFSMLNFMAEVMASLKKSEESDA